MVKEPQLARGEARKLEGVKMERVHAQDPSVGSQCSLRPPSKMDSKGLLQKRFGSFGHDAQVLWIGGLITDFNLNRSIAAQGGR
ncbi:MAG: hypothetical protein WCA95_07705 [Opitutaceae bacterium]